MSHFNFAIDPDADFNYGVKIARSTRDLLKTAAARPRLQAAAPAAVALAVGSDRRMPPQSRTSRAIRRHDTQQAVVNHWPVQVKESTYRNFKISTARSNRSTWVAYFERLDGRPVIWEGTARSMVKTAPYSSETLAIADAHISIDDFLASQPAAEPVTE